MVLVCKFHFYIGTFYSPTLCIKVQEGANKTPQPYSDKCTHAVFGVPNPFEVQQTTHGGHSPIYHTAKLQHSTHSSKVHQPKLELAADQDLSGQLSATAALGDPWTPGKAPPASPASPISLCCMPEPVCKGMPKDSSQ